MRSQGRWRVVGAVVPALIAATLVVTGAEQDTARTATRPHTPDGLTLWVVDDSTKIFPGDSLDSVTRLVEGGEPIDLAGARGETVAFQLVLASADSLPAVDVRWSRLTGPEEWHAEGDITAFLESRLDCPEVDDKVVSLGAGAYPDALIPLRESDGRTVAAPFEVVSHVNTVVWVDVSIPRSLGAGTYRGTLEVVIDGEERRSHALEVLVFDFEIPRRRNLDAWIPLYASRLFGREGLDELLNSEGESAVVEILHAYHRMASEHGFVTQIKQEEPEVEWDEASGELLHVDWSLYDRVNGPVLDGTLFEDSTPPRIWKVGGNTWWGANADEKPYFGRDHRSATTVAPAHQRALQRYAREIRAHFDQRGWSDSRLFMYMIDEPDIEVNGDYPELIRAYGEAIHDSGTNIDHLVTVAPSDSPRLIGAVDIWAAWGAGYVPHEMNARRRLGERAWFYQHHEPFVGGNSVNTDGLSLRSWPWIARRYDVDGIFLWAGNFWNRDPYRDPNNWSDNLLGNGVLFYPGRLLTSIGYPSIRGPVSSFRMKALRRGLYDYEYFQRLEELGGDAGVFVKQIVRHALNEEGASRHWQHSRWGQRGDWSHDPHEWDTVRRLVAQEIVSRSK